jgi:hypothetical protein
MNQGKKKLAGERGYLALEDLQIKSKFPRSKMPIREVGRSGETKKPERKEKEKEEASGRKRGWLFTRDLGAIHLGAKLHAENPGAKLDARIVGVKLDST